MIDLNLINQFNFHYFLNQLNIKIHKYLKKIDFFLFIDILFIKLFLIIVSSVGIFLIISHFFI